MTSNRPSGRPSNAGGVPPTSRRSARQQRLASREANRALARAGTHGSSGSSGPLLMYTVIAVAIAAIVIGGALILTNQSKPATQSLTAPNPPVGSANTPKSIPASGLTLGNADAKHTIDVYEDFQCPYCRDFTVDSEPQIVANYVATGKAKLVWHDKVIIDSGVGGTESLDAANAARCAEDQGMFWPYHDWLYANQYTEGSGAFTKDRLKTIGQLAGVPDLTKFNSCVDSGTHNDEVKSASAASTYTSTPTIVVDGTPTSGFDYATVAAALDKALGVTPSPSAGSSASASAGATASPSASPAATASPS